MPLSYYCRATSSASSGDTTLDLFDLTSRSMLNGLSESTINVCAPSSMLGLPSTELSLKVQEQTSTHH